MACNVGKVLFGAGYGAAVFALFGFLETIGMPTFYDKLLCVPVLNLLVPVFDRAARAGKKRLAWPDWLPTGNRAHMTVWVLVFGAMFGTGFVGKGHPGNDAAFWQSACNDGRRHGCRNLLELHTDNCSFGSANACREAAQLHGRGDPFPADPLTEGTLLARACDLGDELSCNRLSSFFAGGGDLVFEQDCEANAGLSCYVLGTVAMYGLGRGRDSETAILMWQKACDAGLARACGDLGEAWLFGNGVETSPALAAEMFEASCDGGHLPGCANLGLMYLRGSGVPADEERGRRLLEQTCAQGLAVACDLLE